MGLGCCIILQAHASDPSLDADLDKVWAVRRGIEKDILAATLFLQELFRRLHAVSTTRTEQTQLRDLRIKTYARTGRYLRIATAVQDIILDVLRSKTT